MSGLIQEVMMVMLTNALRILVKSNNVTFVLTIMIFKFKKKKKKKLSTAI